MFKSIGETRCKRKFQVRINKILNDSFKCFILLTVDNLSSLELFDKRNFKEIRVDVHMNTQRKLNFRK